MQLTIRAFAPRPFVPDEDTAARRAYIVEYMDLRPIFLLDVSVKITVAPRMAVPGIGVQAEPDYCVRAGPDTLHYAGGAELFSGTREECGRMMEKLLEAMAEAAVQCSDTVVDVLAMAQKHEIGPAAYK